MQCIASMLNMHMCMYRHHANTDVDPSSPHKKPKTPHSHSNSRNDSNHHDSDLAQEVIYESAHYRTLCMEYHIKGLEGIVGVLEKDIVIQEGLSDAKAAMAHFHKGHGHEHAHALDSTNIASVNENSSLLHKITGESSFSSVSTVPAAVSANDFVELHSRSLGRGKLLFVRYGRYYFKDGLVLSIYMSSCS